MAVAVAEVWYDPKNPFWIAALFACFVLCLYTAVVWSVAAVVPAVEDGGEAVAVERAEELVRGRRLDGFMVNLLFSVVCLVVVFGFWMTMGDRGRLNLTVYGLFFVNGVSITRIFGGVMYTVYYFRCREYHGEEIDFLVNHLT
ncbi:uncharacterized protein LOC121800953 [Salvia splendens]|uniref:uncharacterized protein LOC121800953 n=1 Tax=Salvia splendens TaxID=180675 RepID=UPI001C279994|nr:uncharacterized protein LOC121800953 [Salvia splendens]